MRVRTLFISDVHLGSRDCKAELLGQFLQRVRADQLYLVGDTIDIERMSARWYWPESHQALLRQLFALSRNGTRVCYIPGNHDERVRGFIDTQVGDIPIELNCVHELADGRRLLLMHGDEYDFVVRQHPLLAVVGAVLYAQLNWINHGINKVRLRMGREYWSFAGAVKARNGKVVQMVHNFKDALRRHARNAGCDGVLAGHIHMAEIDDSGDVVYCNSGDWVESCTAIAEDFDGNLRLLRWRDVERLSPRIPALLREEPVASRLAPLLMPEGAV